MQIYMPYSVTIDRWWRDDDSSTEIYNWLIENIGEDGWRCSFMTDMLTVEFITELDAVQFKLRFSDGA